MRGWFRGLLFLLVIWGWAGGVGHAALVEWHFEGTVGNDAFLGPHALAPGSPVALQVGVDPRFPSGPYDEFGFVYYVISLHNVRLQIGDWRFEAAYYPGALEYTEHWGLLRLREMWQLVAGPGEFYQMNVDVLLMQEGLPFSRPEAGWMYVGGTRYSYPFFGEWFEVTLTARAVSEPAGLLALGLGVLIWRSRTAWRV
jgi:hypothetical protein